MKKIITITLTSLTLAIHAQAQQINIPGTRVMITPPANFLPATTYTGIQSDSAEIQVFDVGGGNFYKNSATFNKKSFEVNGARVLELKETTVGGYKARYAYIEVKLASRNHAIIFGDSTFCTMIMGMVAGKSKKLNEDVKKSMLSVNYKKRQEVEQLASTFFSLDQGSTTFKFTHGSSHYNFTPGGISRGAGVPNVKAIPLAVEELTAETMADNILKSLFREGVTIKDISNKWSGQINGYDAYEAELYCEKGGKEYVTYEFNVSNGHKAVIFLCTAYQDYEPTIKEFKSLVKTVRFK